VSDSPYPAPAACVEPSLGAEATQGLGRALSKSVVAHLAICPACQLQRAAFKAALAGAVSAEPELRDRLRRLVPRGPRIRS
jgi:hypothetical protein